MDKLIQAFTEILEGAEIYYVVGKDAVSVDCKTLAGVLADAIDYTRPDTDDEVRRLRGLLLVFADNFAAEAESDKELGRDASAAQWEEHEMSIREALSTPKPTEDQGGMREALEKIAKHKYFSDDPWTEVAYLQAVAAEALNAAALSHARQPAESRYQTVEEWEAENGRKVDEKTPCWFQYKYDPKWFSRPYSARKQDPRCHIVLAPTGYGPPPPDFMPGGGE